MKKIAALLICVLAVCFTAYGQSAEEHYRNGRELLHNRNLNDALAEIRKAIEMDPDNAEFYKGLGFVLRDMDDLEGALEAFKKHAAGFEPGSDEYKSAQVYIATVYLRIGKSFENSGDLQKALENYRKAYTIEPSNVVYSEYYNQLKYSLENKAKNSRIRLQLAYDILWRTENLDGAIEKFREVVETDPNFAEARLGLGFALKKKGLLDEAIAEYRKSIWLNPDYIAAHHRLGNALVDKGHLDEAIKELDKASSLAMEQKDYSPVYSIALKEARELKAKADLERSRPAKAKEENPVKPQEDEQTHNNSTEDFIVVVLIALSLLAVIGVACGILFLVDVIRRSTLPEPITNPAEVKQEVTAAPLIEEVPKPQPSTTEVREPILPKKEDVPSPAVRPVEAETTASTPVNEEVEPVAEQSAPSEKHEEAASTPTRDLSPKEWFLQLVSVALCVVVGRELISLVAYQSALHDALNNPAVQDMLQQSSRTPEVFALNASASATKAGGVIGFFLGGWVALDILRRSEKWGKSLGYGLLVTAVAVTVVGWIFGGK